MGLERKRDRLTANEVGSGLLIGQEETEKGVLGPVAVVAVGGDCGGEEGTVAAVRGFDEGDVGIGEDGSAGLGDEADEGVVEGVEDQGGDVDTAEDAGGGGAVVVVVRAGEAGVEGGDAVVELAQGADIVGAGGVKGAGEEGGFTAKAFEEGAEEAVLVGTIAGFVEGVGGRPQVHGGRDADDGAELGRSARAQFPRKLEDEVAAHGVADQGDGAEVVAVGEEAEDGEDVGGEAGVVERGGQVLGAAAVAHVHADRVTARLEELVGVAEDVLGAGGAFKAVEDDGGGCLRAVGSRLPVAVAEDLGGDLVVGGGRDLDQDGLGRAEVVGASEEVPGDRLEMSVRKEAARVKVFAVNGGGGEGWGGGGH